MKNILKFSGIASAFFILGVYISIKIFMPKILYNRAYNLNMLQYKADVDKMVEKDTIDFNGMDLHYLIYGNFNNYKGY